MVKKQFRSMKVQGLSGYKYKETPGIMHKGQWLKEAGFEEVKTTYDLEKEPDFWENTETEHEIKFKSQGIKIKAGIFRKNCQKA